nr:amidohydrolase family protein [uncultured Devosia sp.]
MPIEPYSLEHLDEQATYKAPSKSCDAHFHVFGDRGKYPFGTDDIRYEPPVVSIADLKKITDKLGIDRFVFVQPSCYGFDNSCQLDAVLELGLDSARAVIDMHEDTPDKELERLHSLGTRGVRINVNPIRKPTPGLMDEMLPRIKKIEARCAAICWHLDFLFPDWLSAEFIPEFEKLKVPYSIAHLGMNSGENGPDAPGFKRLLELAAANDNCWLKLTAAYRISKKADYSDVVDMAQAAVSTCPSRILWGSDFPHVSFTQHSTVKLFDLLKRIAPDEAIRNRILVDNPERFYGF